MITLVKKDSKELLAFIIRKKSMLEIFFNSAQQELFLSKTTKKKIQTYKTVKTCHFFSTIDTEITIALFKNGLCRDKD